MWEGVGDWTELQHIDPHSYGHNSVSFPFSWLLNWEPGGPASLGAGFLYRNFTPTDWTSCAPSYIIVRHPPSSCGLHKSHSFNPSTVKIIFYIPRPDAPAIYTGAFPILTARPGRRSIYNNCRTVKSISKTTGSYINRMLLSRNLTFPKQRCAMLLTTPQEGASAI